MAQRGRPRRDYAAEHEAAVDVLERVDAAARRYESEVADLERLLGPDAHDLMHPEAPVTGSRFEPPAPAPRAPKRRTHSGIKRLTVLCRDGNRRSFECPITHADWRVMQAA